MPDRRPIDLQLLGRFAISVADTPPRLITISAPRHRALLAYLAMRPGHAETRERLATLLWSDRPDRHARQNLRQLLLTLRQELKAAGTNPLTIDRDTVSLDPALIHVDALAFLASTQSADACDIERINEAGYGSFLDGLHVESEAFEEWLRIERDRIDAAAAVAFRNCAERYDQASDGPRAIRAAERLVALDPMREDGQRLLLRLTARYRGRAAALAHAERFLQLLRSELAAKPERETATLITDIQRGVFSASAEGSAYSHDITPASDVPLP